MITNNLDSSDSDSRRVDERINELGDWRGEVLARIRTLIKEADPGVVEEMKWKKPSNPAGIPVWSHNGMICTGEAYKDHLKLTFFKGGQLEDPKRLFKGDFATTGRRSIDLYSGDNIDEPAFKDLIGAAVALNESSKR